MLNVLRKIHGMVYIVSWNKYNDIKSLFYLNSKAVVDGDNTIF